MWKRYIRLTEAEWAFRIEKNELELRPIWHHKPERVMRHILVSCLAYVLWKALNRLGLPLPQRPRRIDEVEQM